MHRISRASNVTASPSTNTVLQTSQKRDTTSLVLSFPPFKARKQSWSQELLSFLHMIMTLGFTEKETLKPVADSRKCTTQPSRQRSRCMSV